MSWGGLGLHHEFSRQECWSTSLVEQWIGTNSPMQGTQVWIPGLERFTCCRAIARVPQLLRPSPPHKRKLLLFIVSHEVLASVSVFQNMILPLETDSHSSKIKQAINQNANMFSYGILNTDAQGSNDPPHSFLLPHPTSPMTLTWCPKTYSRTSLGPEVKAHATNAGGLRFSLWLWELRLTCQMNIDK